MRIHPKWHRLFRQIREHGLYGFLHRRWTVFQGVQRLQKKIGSKPMGFWSIFRFIFK